MHVWMQSQLVKPKGHGAKAEKGGAYGRVWEKERRRMKCFNYILILKIKSYKTIPYFFLSYSLSTHLLCWLLILPRFQFHVWFSNNLLAHTCTTNKLSGVRASTGACWRVHRTISWLQLGICLIAPSMLKCCQPWCRPGQAATGCELRTIEILSGSQDINLFQSSMVSRS